MDLSPLQIDRSASTPPPKRRRRRGMAVVAVLIAFVAIGWLFHRPLLEAVDQLRLPAVEVTRVSPSSLLAASAISGTAANGYVVASTRAALSADTPGRIVELNVKEGDAIKKGFVVARLYADEYRASLARAEADVKAQLATIDRAKLDLVAAKMEVTRLESAAAALDDQIAVAAATTKQTQQKLERAERMVGSDVESKQWLDDARAEHDRAVAAERNARSSHEAARVAVLQATARTASQEAAIAEAQARIPVLEAIRDQAKATLEKTEVKAPFDGIVVLKDAEVGEVVSPNSQGGNSRGSVATMVDFSTLEVEVEMPERSIAAVKIGAPVKIFLDAFPDSPYAGRVQRVWPVASRSKATIEVRASFDAADARLRPEMGARVVFLDASEEATESEGRRATAEGVLVPVATLVTIGGRRGVFVVERDQVRFVVLELANGGEERNGRVVASSGLRGQELLVVNPSARLADGDRVRIKETP